LITVAIEDGSLPPINKRKGRTLLIGVRLVNLQLNNVVCKSISIDGLDATDKAIEIVEKLLPLDVVLLDGISFAGFNIIDAERLWYETGRPVIIVTKKKPSKEDVLSALIKHFEDWKLRWGIIEKIMKISKGIHPVRIRMDKGKPIYIEVVGITIHSAKDILKRLTVWGRTPEPLRVAKIIARGLSSAYFKFRE